MADKITYVTPRQEAAARRVKDLYSKGKDDPRYRRNITGEGTGKATGSVSIPQQKIARATSLIEALDLQDKLKK